MNILTILAHAGHTHDTMPYYASNSELTPDQVMALMAFIGFIMFVVLLASIALYVLSSLCLMRIFKKAGVQPWIAWVPFYNTWKVLEIGGQQGFWAVLAIIPIVNIVSTVFTYIALYNIGLKLGKSGSFVLLAIFLSPVWLIWLAFDKAPWNDKAGAPSLAGEQPVPHTTHHTAHK